VETGYGGGSLTFWQPSLLPHFPAVVVCHRRGCSCGQCRQHVSLSSDIVARPEGTVDVPRRHYDALSQLVLALLLWLVMWCHGVVFIVAGVVGVCNGGWGWSNDGSRRRWSLVAMVTQRMWVVAEDGGGG
jgi:hypothetical protein